LVEGNGINATARIAGVSKLTVLRLLADVGSLCADLHDSMVRDLICARVQIDEIWAFVGCKERSKKEGKQGDGDCWTWVALDADTKLVIAYLVGLRDAGYAHEFLHDVASRLKSRIQLTTDGLTMYVNATIDAFGFEGVDFAMLLKLFQNPRGKSADVRYSPGKCTCCLPRTVLGKPDANHISTSYIERQNLTVRMQNRRFTRLTNAFSKRWVNHEHAIALHYFYYNFCRRHQTLGTTPAKAAGVTNRVWTIQDLVVRLENEERKRVGHARINRQDRA
jgi:IS1 family transposase